MTTAKKVTVTVGKNKVTLGKPKKQSWTNDVSFLSAHNDRAAMMAALGMCWESGPSLHAPARYAQLKRDTGEYASQVEDVLLDRGVDLVDLVTAAREALLFMFDVVITADEVQDAEVFSDPVEEE